MSMGTATSETGCTINIGSFMGDTCPICGANNFGGEGFCKSNEEREERQRRASNTR